MALLSSTSVGSRLLQPLVLLLLLVLPLATAEGGTMASQGSVESGASGYSASPQQLTQAAPRYPLCRDCHERHADTECPQCMHCGEAHGHGGNSREQCPVRHLDSIDSDLGAGRLHCACGFYPPCDAHSGNSVMYTVAVSALDNEDAVKALCLSLGMSSEQFNGLLADFNQRHHPPAAAAAAGAAGGSPTKRQRTEDDVLRVSDHWWSLSAGDALLSAGGFCGDRFAVSALHFDFDQIVVGRATRHGYVCTHL